MKNKVRGALLGVLAFAMAAAPSSAQESLRDIMGSTYREKMVFAVYDFPSPDIQPSDIERIALNAIRLYARDTQVRRGIPPAQPYPAFPAKMQFQEQGGGGPKTVCTGELFSMSGLDTTHARAGEITGHRACLFPYAKGYRLNYIALYGQQSGIGNPNPNVAAAMAGRALASLFGIGDASKFIEKIIDRMESGFRDSGIPFKLVQLHPANMPGRNVVTDDLPPSQAAQAVASAQAASGPAPSTLLQAGPAQATVTVVEQGYPAQQNLPTELEKLRQTLAEQRELARQQMAQKGGQPGFNQEQQTRLSARKELHAMGFQYFNREQFFDAIRRSDRLVVELYIVAGGIGLDETDGNQQTALMVAEKAGHSSLAAYLREKGAR